MRRRRAEAHPTLKVSEACIQQVVARKVVELRPGLAGREILDQGRPTRRMCVRRVRRGRGLLHDDVRGTGRLIRAVAVVRSIAVCAVGLPSVAVVGLRLRRHDRGIARAQNVARVTSDRCGAALVQGSLDAKPGTHEIAVKDRLAFDARRNRVDIGDKVDRTL